MQNVAWAVFLGKELNTGEFSITIRNEHFNGIPHIFITFITRLFPGTSEKLHENLVTICFISDTILHDKFM